MKLTARTLGLLSLLILATALLPAHAEAAEAGEKEIERVRRKVEALRAWQLTDELNLDQETTALLFPIMREADEDRFRIEASNRSLLQEMEGELGRPVPDRGRMNGLLDRLVENRMEAARVEVRHLQRVREVLSSEDTARYLLFTIRFEREIRQRISRIQQQNEPRTDSSGRRLFRSPDEDSEGAGGESGSGGSGGSSGGPGGSGGPSGGRGGGGRGR